MIAQEKIKRPEVADVMRQRGEAYRQVHKLPLQQLKVMGAIEACRTVGLGGHIDKCNSCGYERPSYNSCRNRHCPKCQALARERWLEARTRDLLPISYFHVVFTIPDRLNRLALTNKRVLYTILFKAATETLLTLARDPKHLGAQIGIIAVLHTWGQNLMDHPHMHCIVTGGGLSDDQTRWLLPKKMTPKKDFFIHVNIISDLFKKKFLYYLKAAYQAGKITCVGKSAFLSSPQQFKQLLHALYLSKWVTYCKKPFGGVEQVLRYLGRYTHRIAITNNRIVSFDHGQVTFMWKDYREKPAYSKPMTLSAEEFIRRFLLHVLPHGFFKIRYYGILSSRNHKTKLAQCKILLRVKIESDVSPTKRWEEILFELTGIDMRVCPVCGNGRMVTKEIVMPRGQSPP